MARDPIATLLLKRTESPDKEATRFLKPHPAPMKFFTEIFVLYDDMPMPSEDNFCPSFWAARHFDSDGDFYCDGMGDCWTQLELSKIYDDGEQSDFRLNIHRERSAQGELSEDGIEGAAQYVGYKSAGRYARLDRIHHAKNLCVASFFITTGRTDDYLDYLKSVHFFLDYTGGIAANLYEFDAREFAREYLRE